MPKRPALLWTLALLFLASCQKEKPPRPAVAPTPPKASFIDIEDPKTCAACHQAVVAEWKESMHAAAHHAHDPIYAAVRALRVKKEGESILEACAGCHTPRASDHESKEAKRGVACAACHNVARVHADKRGRAALETAAPGLLLGPHDVAEGATVAHGTGPAAPHLKDGQTVCLACHGELRSADDLPICTTGPEHAVARPDGAPAETCVSCHMPVVNERSGALAPRKQHRSHTFAGPHRAWLQDDSEILARAVALTATWTDEKVRISLENRTGHAFPTGFPGRMATLTLTGRDAKGAGVWTPPATHLAKRYEDADGKPTLAPWAKRLAADTRLVAHERRTSEHVPPPGVVEVEAVLSFRLLPPKLAQKLKLGMLPEATPRTVARTVVKAPAAAPP